MVQSDLGWVLPQLFWVDGVTSEDVDEEVVGRSVKCKKGLDGSGLEEVSAPVREKYQRRFQNEVGISKAAAKTLQITNVPIK